MVKVITYGTYDYLHYGHIKLLERAKALGDYLIVAVTADDFDKTRGKINVRQSLIERIESVRATGLADEIIVEEYEGQKIDDIRRLDVDIFTVGSDWVGHFDYLNEFCKVVYLPRTEGVSSSEIRSAKREIRLGLVGESHLVNKFAVESEYVNGVKISGICADNTDKIKYAISKAEFVTADYDKLLDCSDAVYVVSHPSEHYKHIKEALCKGKHVLCESPIATEYDQCIELYKLAEKNGSVLYDGIKTAYSTAYYRLLLMAKSGCIGKIVSVDATCTSMKNFEDQKALKNGSFWNSICGWGPTAMLPVFQLLGTNYSSKKMISKLHDSLNNFDLFTKVDFVYPDAVASIKVGVGVKSEGELVISGTNGYIYVPAPWWKTDYFEARYENQENNRRFFYQLDGEGIRYEIVSFIKAIETQKNNNMVDCSISAEISKIIEHFNNKNNLIFI